jgi:hypothetical protein
MGQHDPDHLAADLDEMAALGCDDVLLAAQENDFAYFTGLLEYTPDMARQRDIRPLIVFWGALNLFGGGRSSQFLLEHPECLQRGPDGAHRSAGCYMNPRSRDRIREMIAASAEAGFEGYFIDEPTRMDCYCSACRDAFSSWEGGDMVRASAEALAGFREHCIVAYVADITQWCKQEHPRLETMCCVMPHDRKVWQACAEVASLDNLGTDIYWVNENREVEEMTPMVRDMDDVCRETGKVHHEWLQCWAVKAGQEDRVFEQGRILVREQPEALYVWAWKGQRGTSESCAHPEAAWERAADVLRLAKGQEVDRAGA